MNYRRILFITGLVAVSLLASCKKNNGGSDNVPSDGFRANIERTGGDGSSKTYINPDWATATEADILWTAHDLIAVNNGIETRTFELTEGEDRTSGIFYTSDGPSYDFTTGHFYAAYPAKNAAGVDNTIVYDGVAEKYKATFTVPATQTYKANSFAEGAMPMVAYSENQTLAFKNVFGGICIPLVGDGQTVTKVVLTSATSENLCGTFTADCTSPTPTPTCTSGGGNSITLNCAAPVALHAVTPTYFCFMVPPASLASGFAVTPYNGETAYEELSTTANPGITRSVIKKVDRNLEVEEAVVVPDGAINGQFTINPSGDKVYFSYGNLQYIGSAATPYWKFADNQWDFFGETTGQSSTNPIPNVDRDLFGWGTSGYHNDADPYNTNYYPWSISSTTVNSTYNTKGFGPSTNMTDPNLVGTSANYDWGIYNDIKAGETLIVKGTYRTLTIDEWYYLFYTRKVTVGGVEKVPYGEGVVNNVNGMILLPDNWDGSVCIGFTYGLPHTDYEDNNYINNSFSESTTPKWSEMEAAGCVFLPAAGYRYSTTVDYYMGDDDGPLGQGEYWSSTYLSKAQAYLLRFTQIGFSTTNSYNRNSGLAVRLVRPAE